MPTRTVPVPGTAHPNPAIERIDIMGGLFSSPEPPPPPEPPADDPAEKEREARLEAIARRRRGREGTIETGPTGVLAEAPDQPAGKTKLGE
jgi:hypothetical protein